MLGHPERLRDAVEPRTWRARVLGPTRGDTDQLKHLACTWATAALGQVVDDPDEARVAQSAPSLARRHPRISSDACSGIQARGKREEKRQLDLLGKEAAR